MRVPCEHIQQHTRTLTLGKEMLKFAALFALGDEVADEESGALHQVEAQLLLTSRVGARSCNVHRPVCALLSCQS